VHSLSFEPFLAQNDIYENSVIFRVFDLDSFFTCLSHLMNDSVREKLLENSQDSSLFALHLAVLFNNYLSF